MKIIFIVFIFIQVIIFCFIGFADKYIYSKRIAEHNILENRIKKIEEEIISIKNSNSIEKHN